MDTKFYYYAKINKTFNITANSSIMKANEDYYERNKNFEFKSMLSKKNTGRELLISLDIIMNEYLHSHIFYNSIDAIH